MAQFYECWQRRRTTLDELQHLLDDAKANEARERSAAIHIQRLFRGQFVRATIATHTNAVILLARVYRGHLARRRCRRLRNMQLTFQQHAVFAYYATIIQKMLRGMHSRRTKLDIKVRKAFMREIADKGERMRRTLAENLLKQQQEEAMSNEAAARRELVEVTQNLHHLVSTRTIAGVYNSPMLASEATAFGVPVEAHIRDNAKSLVAAQLAATKPPTRLTPYPPSNKASLQAAAPYDTTLNAVRTQKKYHKLRRISAQDFQAVHNTTTNQKGPPPGVNAGVEYLHDWENPYKKRGIPRAKEDLLPRLTTLGKPPKDKEKPFYLSAGGNKSKVYANDRFDV